MTKLEIKVSISSLECVEFSGKTAEILGVDQRDSVSLSSVVANQEEFEKLKSTIQDLVGDGGEDSEDNGPFRTLNVVFRAPNASTAACKSDRKPLETVLASPMKAIHSCGELELACFTHMELSSDRQFVLLTAVEYSRAHRSDLLRMEFGSWLLEDHIEKSVLATTLQGQVVFWNRFAEELYHYTREEAMGKNIMELTPSEMTQDQAMEIMGSLGQGNSWSGMFRVKRKDGDNFMAHVTDTPILDQDGAVKYIVGVSYDCSQLQNLIQELETLNDNLETEVQERTKQLLEREKHLRMVGFAIKQSETGVMIMNQQGRVEWSNDAVYHMLAIDQKDVLGQCPWLFPMKLEEGAQTKKFKDLKTFFDIAVCDGGGSTVATVTHSDGRMSAVDLLSLSVQTIAASEQEALQCMITLRDLTAQRKADVAQLAAEKAAAASETKTEMMAMLSHELRTPLQGIMGVSSTLLADIAPEDGLTYDSLSTILASSRLLLTLINNVLDVRKMDVDKLEEMDLKPVLAPECIRDSVRFLEPFASLNEVQLVFEASEGGEDVSRLTVLSHRLRLQQVLVNLMSNAIKYTNPGTSVVVSARRCLAREALHEARNAASSDIRFLSSEGPEDGDVSGDVVIISIRDHGRGIPVQETSKLFGEFVQLDISAEKDSSYKGGKAVSVGQSSGSGLGLNLALRFVTRMKGHIWCNNCDSGEGAIFSFSLACCSTLNVGETNMVAAIKHEADLSPEAAARFRILLVDDSRINVRVLSRMLSRLGVKEISIAYNGIGALDYLDSVPDGEPLPNLILSDLQMPEMDGFGLMAELREKGLKFAPLVMACSADWMPETEKKCLDAGFDGILRKPIAFSDLKEFLANTELIE